MTRWGCRISLSRAPARLRGLCKGRIDAAAHVFGDRRAFARETPAQLLPGLTATQSQESSRSHAATRFFPWQNGLSPSQISIERSSSGSPVVRPHLRAHGLNPITVIARDRPRRRDRLGSLHRSGRDRPRRDRCPTSSAACSLARGTKTVSRNAYAAWVLG